MIATIDRRAAYFRRSADHRAADPVEFMRRTHVGEAIQARLHRPKSAGKVIVMRRRVK